MTQNPLQKSNVNTPYLEIREGRLKTIAQGFQTAFSVLAAPKLRVQAAFGGRRAGLGAVPQFSVFNSCGFVGKGLGVFGVVGDEQQGDAEFAL